MTGLPPRSLAYDNSRFCFLKFTKPADEHHLQVLPSLRKPSLLLFIGTLKRLRNLTAQKNIPPGQITSITRRE
jgi:hypothetical protein